MARLRRDVEECSDRAARSRSGGKPLVDVLLRAGGGGSLVGLVDPEEELHRFGDLLFGRMNWASRGRACGCLGADPSEVVPGGEVLNGDRKSTRLNSSH